MARKIIICCKDKATNQQCYKETYISNCDDITEWQKNNPSFKIEYAFYANTDICRHVSDREQWFLFYCNNYNMSKADLHRPFRNNDGRMVEIVGLKPTNRKYCFILLHHDDMKEYKASAEYMKRQYDFWKGSANGHTP